MEWKRRIRREAREKGHRLSPLVRQKSLADKESLIPVSKLPLAARSNEYNAACSRCSMPVHATTYPGQEAQISFLRAGRKIYEMPPCKQRREERSDSQ